uniref:Zinc finger CCCH domain-containing protein 14 n=1 Tax=Amblyomma triste TaxID=251400 RepID=A0A023GC46_AMBTT
MDGNEVTQKIRAAIKTKLVELGAYVDDELPDYIMVMIANKKTKEQMTQDLSLFLGDSTVSFTSWLQGVLDHLQTIATEAKQRSKEQHVPLPAGEPVRPIPPPHLDLAKQQEVPVATLTNIAVAPPYREEEPSLPEYNDEVLALKADPEPDDDLADDLRAMAEQAPPTRHTAAVTGSSSISLVRPIPRVIAPERARMSPARERPPTKKSVVAVAAAVVRRKPHFLSEAEDDDEEYDPSNPSVGSIASVVKVSERRSSVPESMQANKLLLLKAMKAAHQSVSSNTSRRNPSARVEPYQPTPLRELGSKRRRPISSRLGSSARPEDIDEEDSAPPAKRPGGVSIKDRLGRRQAAATSAEEPSLPIDVERGLPRASRIVGAIVPEVRGDGTSRAGTREKAVAAADTEEAVTDGDSQSMEPEEDSDLLELEVAREEVHSVVRDATPTSTPKRQSGPDDLTGIAQRMGASGDAASPKQWPRFVVTLDGVDPASFQGRREVLAATDLDELPDEEGEEELVQQRPSVKTRLRMPLPRVTSAELMEGVVEEEEAMVVDDGGAAPRLLEKCRYWPACKNGDRCPFHHPSVPCKAFPNCKFRDKCLFIHPNCKYDAFCKRKDCVFTHASRRNFTAPTPPVVSSPSVQQCKFFPHCTNIKCPFFHPKPCKFGVACQSSSCPYTHPEGGCVPPPSKLKWISASASSKAGETVA